MPDAFQWLKRHGMAWALRLAFIVTGGYLLLNTIGVRWAPLDIKVLIGLNVAVLWLFLEMMIGLNRRQRDARMREWSSVATEARKRIRPGAAIDIACSSTSSFYFELFEAISGCRDIRLRIVMRQAKANDPDRLARLREYSAYWESLSDGKNFNVEIRYSEEAIVRLLRVDEMVAIGAYVWSERRRGIFGHTVPMVTATPGDDQHDMFVRYFEGVFDRVWRDAVSDPEVGKNGNDRTAGK